MGRMARNPKEKHQVISAEHEVRAFLSEELYLHMQQMASTDERTHQDFIRWLLRREWERRNAKVKT